MCWDYIDDMMHLFGHGSELNMNCSFLPHLKIIPTLSNDHHLLSEVIGYVTKVHVSPSTGLMQFVVSSHYSDITMSLMASDITSISTVCWTFSFILVHIKIHQSSATLAFVGGIHWWPVVSPYKGPVTRKYYYLMTSSCSCAGIRLVSLPF